MRTGRGRWRRPPDAAPPWVFAVLFWALLALGWGTSLIDALVLEPSGRSRTAAALVVVSAVTAIVAAWWRLLPWAPTSRRSGLTTVGFAAVVLVFGYLTAMTWAQGLLLVAVANAVFVLGTRHAVVLGAGLLPPGFAALYLSQLGELSLGEAAFRMWSLALVGAVVVGLSEAIVTARRERATAAELLTEVQERSDRIAELTAAAERTRLARDIHHAVGHHLTLAHLQLLNATRTRRSAEDQADDRAWDHVVAARATVKAALSEVRRSVRALDPAPLPDVDLPGSLATVAAGVDGTGITANLTVHGDPRPLGAAQTTLLYRAVQEGLTNAVRHGPAARVDLRLDYRPSSVTVSVVDDGGTAAPASFGYGLASLRARAGELGGTLRAGPVPGGYRLEITIPLDRDGTRGG